MIVHCAVHLLSANGASPSRERERERGESVTVTQRLWTPCRSAWHQCKEGEYTCSNTSPCLLVQFIPAMSRGDRAEALLVQKVHTQSV